MASQRGKYLLKNTVIFALGNLGTKFISFFLVPIYTNILSTSQYGTVDLIYTIGTVLVPLLTLNIGEAVMRFALDKDADQNAIMSTGILGLELSLVLGLVAIPCGALFAEVKPYIWYLYLYTVSLAFSQMFLCNLRGRELLLRYSIGNIIQTLSIALSNIFFLAVLHRGVEGYFTAYILSNFITAAYAFVAGHVWDSWVNFRIDKALAKQMIMYSVVLIPNSFMWWIMNSSDRLMVTAMVGVAVNGIYAVAYKVPTLLSTLSSVFNQAWSYSAIREHLSEDKVSYNNIVYGNLMAIVSTVGSGLMMIMKLFLKYYVGADYYTAWMYTPVLIIGFVFMTLGAFVATSYTVHKDSLGFLVSGTVGAIINIALNFCLIPICGAMGAAVATCLSYFTVFVYRSWDTRKYLKLEIINIKYAIGIGLLVVSGFTMFIDSMIGQLLLILEFILMLIVYNRLVLDIFKLITNLVKKCK